MTRRNDEQERINIEAYYRDGQCRRDLDEDDLDRIAQTIGGGLLLIAICLMLLTAVLLVRDFLALDIQTLAPTAAEVLADGFDLEVKVAGIEP